MKRVFLIFLLFINFQLINAQYTDIINSKRPGFSESPYSVGTNVYQFETGLFYKHSNNESILAYPNSFGGELFFRFGMFFERLEINLNAGYTGNEVKNPFGDNYISSDFSDLRFGVKYLIYQQEYTDKSKEIRSWKKRTAFDKKRLIPSVGVYAGVNGDFVTDNSLDNGVSFKGAILLQNDFSDRLVLLTNLIVDEIGAENIMGTYIVTLTYAIHQNWSIFIENLGKYQQSFYPEYQTGAGAAYLFSRNLQVDASIRSNLVDDYTYIYASAGVSWRIDKHKDALIKTTTNTSKKPRKKKGFFSRLFGKN